jgi:hypothetical protein
LLRPVRAHMTKASSSARFIVMSQSPTRVTCRGEVWISWISWINPAG